MAAPDVMRLPAVKKRTGLSKSEIYRRIKAGTFPASQRISSRVAVWYEDQVNAWRAAQIAALEVDDLL